MLDGIESVHVVDFNDDGFKDIFTASRNDNRVMLFELLDDGYLFPRTLTTDLDGASVVKSFDLDNDGDLDILASGSDPGDHSICWWEVDGREFSEKKTIVNINNNAFQDFHMLDIDNDGDNDIVSVEFSTAAGPGSLSLWRNNDLEFEFVELSDNCIDGRQIEILDWDQDGDLDFIIGEGLGDKLVYWKNEGNLVFVKSTFFNYDLCASFAISDIDKDGDMDFAALSFTSDEVSIWLNDGSDEFEKILIEDSFDGPDKLLLHDIDNDQDEDLIVAYYLEDLLVVYENEGDLNFNRVIIDNNFDGARDISIADLDNDKSPDIIGASLGENRVIIWINDIIVSSDQIIPSTETLIIYPNPVINKFMTNSSVYLNKDYRIYNSSGILISSGILERSTDVSYLSSGLYFLEIFTGKIQTMGKFVVN